MTKHLPKNIRWTAAVTGGKTKINPNPVNPHTVATPHQQKARQAILDANKAMQAAVKALIQLQHQQGDESAALLFQELADTARSYRDAAQQVQGIRDRSTINEILEQHQIKAIEWPSDD